MALVIGLIILPGSPSPGQVDSLGLSAEVDGGPIFVGQAIELRARISGHPSDPVILAPALPAAEILPRDESPMSDPGDRSPAETRRFVLIARRAGVLEVPPFRLRAGGRTASSRPLRLKVSALPTEGRTSAFLGGVGSFELRAEVDPQRIRLGQVAEFRIRVSGDGSWGMTRGPDLAAWAKASGVRAEPRPEDGPVTPGPTKEFRYRVRPTRPGRLTLPPVSVATFEPTSRRYSTRTTSSLILQVEQAARFDPATLRYGELPASARDSSRSASWWAVLALLGVLLTVGGWFAGREATRARRRHRGTSLARALAERLDPSADAQEVARQVTAGFAELLQVIARRPPGVLTPPEAREAFGNLIRDEVGDRSGRLIERCDRAIYGEDGPDPAELVAEAREVLGMIRGSPPARGKAEGGSRDRVE